MINWIYSTPTIQWGALLIVLVVAIAALGLVAAHRFIDVEVRRSQNDVTAAAMGIVGVAYAVLLAFIAVATWESYSGADKIVDQEASYAGDLYRETIGLSDADVAPIRADIKKYLEQVVHEEWPSQQGGHINQTGRPTLVHIHTLIVSLDPKTQRESIIVAELLRTMNALYDARRTRILAADGAIPEIVWWIVAFGSALTVGFTYLFGTHDFRMHLAVTGLVAASMALVIVLIVALDRPFRGDLSVSVEAYENVGGSIAAVDYVADPVPHPTHMNSTVPPPPASFSPYQKRVVGMLAFLQFAVILDFMLMSPLGAVIMPALQISPKQFGLVVSAYAFSAGASGLLTAGFADRFDRKRLLLFFYAGFVIGTLWCGLAQGFETLLMARIVTGLFGGVIGSIVLAISTDLFPPQMRGRVMGMIQTAFAASQVLGIPIGLYLSNHWNWHVPFLAMAGLGLAGGLVVASQMQPVADHLGKPQEHSPWMHLLHTVMEPKYLLAFATVTLLATGGYMLMPFSSAFAVNNLGISLSQLPTVYLVTGLSTIFVGPLVGKAADSLGKFRVFLFGTALSILMVSIYTHLGPTSLPVLIVINTVLFIGIFSRMIPFQALVSSVPAQTQRGSFNAISASLQQLSGGIASVIAGHIVSQGADGRLQDFDVIGYVVIATSLVALTFVWNIHKAMKAREVP